MTLRRFSYTFQARILRGLQARPVFVLPSRSHSTKARPVVDIADAAEHIPTVNIRNWAIISHIDHGKSTLSDRILELTGVIEKSSGKQRVLDKLSVEQRRGITVKAQTCSMIYEYNDEQYLLNLIDTPGHVDFSSEVTHSLAACEGCILLVDATRGIQAQTVSNFYLAFARNLLEEVFELDRKEALLVSSKTGKNVPELIDAIIQRVPHPICDENASLKCVLIDSWFNTHRGVIGLVRILDGKLVAGAAIYSVNTHRKYVVNEVGFMHPNPVEAQVLLAGQVGYVNWNMKNSAEAILGDTFTQVGHVVKAMPGFEKQQPKVYVNAFPLVRSDYDSLSDSIDRLALNDRSIFVEKDTSDTLGIGWRLGFLGSLHLSVFLDRLKDEYKHEVLVTAPTVPYRITWKDGMTSMVSNPSNFPDARTAYAQVEEPMALVTLVFPREYVGPVMNLCESCRGTQQKCSFLSTARCVLEYLLPMSRLMDGFFDQLKSCTHGYGSLEYEDAGFAPSDIVKLSYLVNGMPIDALCTILHRSSVLRTARASLQRLKSLIPRQLYEVALQAMCEKHIIARETISAARKNVTAKCYGGDVTRKMKLLKNQREGKKRMKQFGNVSIDQGVSYTSNKENRCLSIHHGLILR
ncbi:GTPase [Schizosaccharomyces japonicus yFS275]|uniref:GTPase n=1 Tax=Schizosaccharomyces japonicus (strain yFS275 / FY16936) TaxID=402676 RepID=UPI00038990AD|nr:GTPase [Schizosaccharomyces japonicus yFS275]EEB09170.2 GTPase [Schizosaccharomyces japonicus yFS275]